MRGKLFSRLVALVCLVLSLTFMVSVSDVYASSVSISANSATITVGKSVNLQILEDGSAVSGAVWGSSDASVASVSSDGKVTGVAAGSAVITATYNGATYESLISVVKSTVSENVRYNVLLLDCSGSMKGTPMTRQKAAAKHFAKTVLSADGTNYVAVVKFGDKASQVIGFTKSLSKVNKAINSVSAGGDTNVYGAFTIADKLMKSVSDGDHVMKNVILCSDGLPNMGSTSKTGKYSSSDHSKDYKYANALYKKDVTMKKAGYFIYALGFFHNSTGNDLSFGKQLMKDLASKDKYFIISKSSDIDDAFTKIARAITSLTLSDKKITIYAGKTYALTAYDNGKKADGVTWTSSKPSIATVNSKGVVKGVSAGTTVVTASLGGSSVTCTVVVKAVNKFAGGDGSKSNPYKIKTFAQLKNVSLYPDKYFIQMNDIDCGGATLLSMFTSSNPFKGVYDGQNYTISNLKLKKNDIGLGIFGVAGTGSVLKNIKVKNISAKLTNSGELYGGALAGISSGKIVRCVAYSTNIKVNDKTGYDDYGSGNYAYYNACGGLVGIMADDGLLSRCKAYNIKISGNTRDVGGLAGAARGGAKVEHLYVKNITASGKGGAGASVGSLKYAAACDCNTAGKLKLTGYFRYDNNFGYTSNVTWY